MLHAARTGTAPSTTTLRLDGGYMRPPGTTALFFPDGSLGRTITRGTQTTPTDFDRSRYLNYLPVGKGWVVGTLGAAVPESSDLSPAAAKLLLAQYEVQRAQAVLVKDSLEVKRLEEELKSARSNRIWGAVAGLVGVAGVIVAVIALRRD